jgi:hypothetical protein
MSEIQSATPETIAAAQKLLVEAGIGLDTASLAAQNLAAVSKLQDAETAAQEIESLKGTVAQLQQTLGDMQPVFEAAKAFIDSSPEILQLKKDLESTIADFEGDLPPEWKTRLAAFLTIAKNHFGI